MPINLRGRSVLTFQELTPEELRFLLELGRDRKAAQRTGRATMALRRKHIAVLEEQPSLCTRCAFEAAVAQEEGHISVLQDENLAGIRGSLAPGLMGCYFDGIGYLGGAQSTAEVLAAGSGVPVWNGQTDSDEPLQVLGDLLTVEERCGLPLRKIRVVFSGDLRCSRCRSWIEAAAKLGMHFTAYGPQETAKQLGGEFLKRVFASARQNGGLIELTDDHSSLKRADVLCGGWTGTDGKPPSHGRAAMLLPFQVNLQTLQETGNSEIVYLHSVSPDLQYFSDLEGKENIAELCGTEEKVLHSRHCAIRDQAENQIYAIRAVLSAALAR